MATGESISGTLPFANIKGRPAISIMTAPTTKGVAPLVPTTDNNDAPSITPRENMIV